MMAQTSKVRKVEMEFQPGDIVRCDKVVGVVTDARGGCIIFRCIDDDNRSPSYAASSAGHVLLHRPEPESAPELTTAAKFAMAMLARIDAIRNSLNHAAQLDRDGVFDELPDVMREVNPCPLLDILTNSLTDDYADEPLLDAAMAEHGEQETA